MLSTLEWIREAGLPGMAAYLALYVLSCIFFLPGSILTLAAGTFYGLWQGTILVSLASISGASCAFGIGRTLARGFVENKIKGNEKFTSMDEAVGREGWKIVGLTRLSPVFPFNLLNYAYGITRVSFRDYFWASWIGMLPGTLLYVYLGSLAGDLVSLSANTPQGTDPQTVKLRWMMRIIGLIATAAVTIYISKIAKNALSSKVSAKSR